jgi:hypothetical protein
LVPDMRVFLGNSYSPLTAMVFLVWCGSDWPGVGHECVA